MTGAKDSAAAGAGEGDSGDEAGGWLGGNHVAPQRSQRSRLPGRRLDSGTS
jgi:hypothetical protein